VRIEQEGPQLVDKLAGNPRTGRSLRLHIEELIARGLLRRAAFTPTDALHALGRLELWNCEAACLGADLLAARACIPVQTFCEQVVDGMVESVAVALVSKGLEDETGQPCHWDEEALARNLLSRALRPRTGVHKPQARQVGCELNLYRPIVAIGAPVAAYLPAVAHALHTELVIPPHADVANAVGAVAGGIIMRHQLLISPLPGQLHGWVRLFLPAGCRDFASLDQAVTYAHQVMVPYAEETAHQAGAGEVEVRVEREDHWAHSHGSLGDAQGEIYLGSDLTFLAVGRPAAIR
jgi:N-methylhydantoinase A/oxoprolinase/acetone carboxylase beta subunit